MESHEGSEAYGDKERKEEGFGKFLIEVASFLTLIIAAQIATVYSLSPADVDKISRDKDPGLMLLDILRQRGKISSTDISTLIDALEQIRLDGIAAKVEGSFERNVSGTLSSQRCSRPLPEDVASFSSGMKEKFLEDLKVSYAEMYNGILPIPYQRESWFCVNKVFIDSGIEYFNNEGGGRASTRTWEKLGSYNSIFTNACLARAMVFILYGEPGYGKSTVALQFVYDWCNPSSDSPLKDYDVLIFLRLRYFRKGFTFFKAIKEFLLPSDTTVSERDIKSIIQNGKSVVIILDGLEEYSCQIGNNNDDITKILAKKMLRKCKVIATTRPSRQFPTLSYATRRLRLTGFDYQARKEYILKTLVDGDSEAAARILQKLQQNPVFADICQVPMFFVLFAHISYEDTSLVFDSVTGFFRYVVTCFYNHAQIKASTHFSTCTGSTISKHQRLDKVAFDSLQGKNRQIVWERDNLVKLIGETLYKELCETGILVEENVRRIVDDPGTSAAEHIQQKTDVSFYHKLFCEWYAAHHVAEYVSSPKVRDLKAFFEDINPVDLQYVYRIACGLNPAAAEKIIQYLHSIEGGDKFAILCILEQTGKVDKIKDTIRQMCFEGVIVSGHDSLLLQRSSIQLIEIAATHEIPIEYVNLVNCFQSVDLSTAALKTMSGLALTSRIPFKELVVSLSNREMTQDEAIDILRFSSKCLSLRHLRYYGCVPPRSFHEESTLLSLKSRNVKVRWNWAPGNPFYVLNFQTGRWENEKNGSEPTFKDFERMLSKDAEDRKRWTETIFKGWVTRDREVLRKDAQKEWGDN